MKWHNQTGVRNLRRIAMVALAAGFVTLSASDLTAAATLKPETVEAWESYVRSTEARIVSEVESSRGFLVRDFMPAEDAATCGLAINSGEICVVKMETEDENRQAIEIPGGMVHHWMGTVFIPNVELEKVLSWVQQYSDHELYFDEVEDSGLLSRDGDVFEILLRLKRKKVVTVHYNTEHHVEYKHLDPDRVYSKSYTTKIAQLDNPGTPEEREKPEGKDSGFLWRLNSYWRYQQVDGGVIVESESISLSRGIPSALKWIVGGYINSVPRESMESTLGSIRNGVTSKISLASLEES